jgi:ABC-type glycerol-3-phosphate transport system substrate-binding protein
VNAEAVVYNKKLFAKAGIEFPQSRKDLFAACKKLRATGAIPFILNVGLGWTMQQWDREVLVFAGDGDYYRKMLKDDAPFARDKPYGKVLAFVREMIDQGCTELGPASPARIGVPTNWGESRQLMASGKVGMWFLSSWSIAQIVEMAERMHTGMTAADLGFAPLPIDDSGVGKVLMDPDYGIAISAQSTNKETAKAFLYFLLNIADLANASGFIPADVNVPATLPQIAELQRLKPIFIDAKSPPAEFSNAMVAAGFDFMTGTYLRAPLLAKDFDEALDDMNKRWSAAIGKR